MYYRPGYYGPPPPRYGYYPPPPRYGYYGPPPPPHYGYGGRRVVYRAGCNIF